MLYLMFNTPASAEIVDLDPEVLQKLQGQGVPVIDIRREDEWEDTGVIPGSLLLTFFDEQKRYDLDRWLAEFGGLTDRREPFVLICRNGIRTKRLGRYLDGQGGWPAIHHLAGGIRHWIEEGFPVETYPPPSAGGK